MKRCRVFLCLLASFLFYVEPVLGNPWNSKVVLQGFWWDYWNNNYPNNWSTYLADLAPRLRELGIDAVWIPPTVKNKNATGSVGYAPFDHYDLGDKFQGGSVGTRFGTKDQYLRAVAILHANGIDVIQDMVWNHLDDAGSDTGAGGQDPTAPSNQWKNFRYACYATPATTSDATNYGARRGRFPKNWQNFHPNPDHNTEGDDITAGFFGPDICYYSQARGLSSNCSYNPPQEINYMRNGIRNWSIWLKKQTGVDGFRLDAAKHFEVWATQDFLWNLANGAGFASGGDHMYAVGEFIGSIAQMDGWIDGVNSANGGTTDLVGTFDFNLRGALKSVIDSGGSYNLANIPGAQQNRRSRTAPFVNNHDTFRPQLDPNGRYIGWDGANEIGGHIDPNDPRIQMAYTIAFAVDGSPQVFFEDLFDLHSTGKRWTHWPTNLATGATQQLPARDWLANLIWCHQKLNFKDGAYKVRLQNADCLVIERSGHALIGVTDSYSTAQSFQVQTDFGANVVLHDYSGANPSDASTDTSGRFTMNVPPCDGSNLRRGYSIWAPAGISGGFAPAIRNVTQEWEMADDLGDSHPSSLRQGGALPSNSTAQRTAGKIFPAAGSTVTITGYASVTTVPWKISVYDPSSLELTNVTGNGNLQVTFNPSVADYHTIRIQNTDATNPSQTVWIKTAYIAPRSRFTAAPVITQNLTNVYAVAGGTTHFEITASSNPTATFQWMKNGADIGGATSSTLVITNILANDGGNYSVRLWNEARVIQSAISTLTVYDSPRAEVAGANYSPQTGFTFHVAGKVGLNYAVQTSSDLANWAPVAAKTAPFTVTEAAGETARFYRLIYLP